MKLLTLLLTTTAASAATLPLRLPPTRPRDAPQYRLLHTLTPTAPSNLRLLAAAPDGGSTESTKGGAVLTLPASDTASLSSVQATFRVPQAKPPTTGPTANNPVGVYAASFWVGIDGITTSSCNSGKGGATLRAGVDIFYDGTLGGEQSPFAWYQFAAPGNSGSSDETGFEGFGVVPGDVVRFTLTTAAEGGDKKEVVVLGENFGGNVSCTEGATPIKSVRQVLPVGEGQVLCGREANFVVEDFPLSGLPNVPVALANFTSVTFGHAGVTLVDGSKKDVTGAQVFDVRQQAQGGSLTSCGVVDGDKVKCTRVVG